MEEESKPEAHTIFSCTFSCGQKRSSVLLHARPSKFSCLDDQMWHVGFPMTGDSRGEDESSHIKAQQGRKRLKVKNVDER